MPKLVERREKIDDILMKVSENATGRKVELGMGTTQNIEDIKDKAIKKATVIQEFNLTKPKPKALP